MTVRTDDDRAAFVREQTTLTPVPLVPELSVYTATVVTPLWFATAQWLDDHDADVPFWSVPWAGGQALARFVLDYPGTVRGKRVLDFACGGGLVGLAAARAGARVRAVDVDPLATVATRLNAAANGLQLTAIETVDLLDHPLPDVDVLLAGDVWYEREPSARFRAWFRALARAGTRVLTGDPGRLHAPRRARELARYQVSTPLELESVIERTGRVLEIAPAALTRRSSARKSTSVQPSLACAETRAAYRAAMDSINREQPEDVFANLYGAGAVAKIRELVGKAKTCLFCTDLQTGKPFATRPMSVQKIDDQGVFWFLSAVDSHKNEQLQRDDSVQMLFQGSSYSDFLTLYGKATISKDRAKIEELWEPILKDWFTEGPSDPRITVIAVRPRDGYYWDTKHGMAVAFAKRLVGAAIGKTLDDSVEGSLKP